MSEHHKYTTQLQAGLGLIEETKLLLELWEPGTTTPQLVQAALQSGHFPNIAARRLRNIIAECFAPRYLVNDGLPAGHLKRLQPHLSALELQQLMLLYTCRGNPVLADFIRQVYWERYRAGYQEISNQDARRFLESAIDHGRTAKRWSESTIRRVAGYLTGCCADYGMLDHGRKTSRRILSFHLAPKVAVFLAYDLHFAGLGDHAVLFHEDWALFGAAQADVLAEIKRMGLKGFLIAQTSSDVVTISWKYSQWELLYDAILDR